MTWRTAGCRVGSITSAEPITGAATTGDVRRGTSGSSPGYQWGATVDAEHVRIESPGESWAVESALLGRDEPEDRGRIRGLEVAYRRMQAVLEGLPPAQFMNAPADIVAMFDKVETKRRLTLAGGKPRPPSAACPATWGLVRTFDELWDVMREAPRRRAFVKPRHGSSASGVVALTMSADRVTAVTAAEGVADRLYK